jgi:hypothetical protein
LRVLLPGPARGPASRHWGPTFGVTDRATEWEVITNTRTILARGPAGGVPVASPQRLMTRIRHRAIRVICPFRRSITCRPWSFPLHLHRTLEDRSGRSSATWAEAPMVSVLPLNHALGNSRSLSIEKGVSLLARQDLKFWKIFPHFPHDTPYV